MIHLNKGKQENKPKQKPVQKRKRSNTLKQCPFSAKYTHIQRIQSTHCFVKYNLKRLIKLQCLCFLRLL